MLPMAFQRPFYILGAFTQYVARYPSAARFQIPFPIHAVARNM
jgi:hypothetical protein